MTDKSKDDHKAMLRAQAAVLLSQAQAQSIDLQRALSMAQGNPALQARLAAAMAHIDSVVSELSQALSSSSFPLHAADLMALRGIVQAGGAASLQSEAAAQAGAAGTMATPAQTAEVAASSAETRQEVQSLDHDLFDRHLFDRYLHFSSPEDEVAFRKREAEARAYIAAQLAKGTPEGNLNASGGMMGYMLDAHAHGAGDSPDFQSRWDALVAKTERQYAAMRAAGQSTDEFDRRLRESVRRFLKEEKHLSDAEIERRMAAARNPLEAAKGLLGTDKGSRVLEHKSQLARHIEQAGGVPLVRVEAAPAGTPKATPPVIKLDAMAAKLKAAGITLTGSDKPADPAHGVTAPKPPGPAGQGVGG